MNQAVRMAVILAAGTGTRLGETGRLMPKGFLQLGGRPIVEESVMKLQKAGIQTVVIVTGHLRDRYDALADNYPGFVRTVHNPIFATSGSLYSLACARADLTEDFLLLESDLIYEQHALDVLQDQPRGGILVSGPTRAGDEVWVEARDGRLWDMDKDPDRLDSSPLGELVGLSRITRSFFSALMEYALPKLHKDPMRDYEVHGLVKAARKHPLPCHLLPDLLWAEIDDDDQLENARTRVYPEIIRKDGCQGTADVAS